MRVQPALDFLAVGFGGAVGAMARYAVIHWFPRVWGGAPAATLTVNLLGCGCIGLLIGFFDADGSMSPRQELLIRTGFLGGLTTYSAFAADLHGLQRQGSWSAAAIYLLAHLALGMLALGLGVAIARPLTGWARG
jgi:CrcB protein